MLNGTKSAAFVCVTKPKPESAEGFPTLCEFHCEIPILHRKGIDLRSCRLGLHENPVNTRIHYVCVGVQVRIGGAIRLLVGEERERAETNVWNIHNILTVNSIRPVVNRTDALRFLSPSSCVIVQWTETRSIHEAYSWTPIGL